MRNIESENRRKGIMTSALVHLLLLLLFILTALTTPLPLPEEEGILIDIGNTEEGMGAEQPEFHADEMPVEENIVNPSEEDAVTEKEILTQDVEDAPKIEIKKPDKKVTPEVIAEDKKVEKIEPEIVKPIERVVNPKTLFQKSNKSSGQGTSDKPGDERSPEGKKEGGPEGTGTGDKGTGDGDMTYVLIGRKLTQKPDIDLPYLTQKVVVVVSIVVDREGNVTQSKAGARGSTTTNVNLYKKAEQASFETKFSSKTDAPEEQRGTITFVFIPK